MNKELNKYLDDVLEMEPEIQTLDELFEAANTEVSINDTSDSFDFLVYDEAELVDLSQLLEGNSTSHYQAADY